MTKVTVRQFLLTDFCGVKIQTQRLYRMKKNLNSFDRFVRLLFAVVVAVLFITDNLSGTPAVFLGIAAFILAVTALIDFCPIYYLLGISTRKKTTQQ